MPTLNFQSAGYKSHVLNSARSLGRDTYYSYHNITHD